MLTVKDMILHPVLSDKGLKSDLVFIHLALRSIKLGLLCPCPFVGLPLNLFLFPRRGHPLRPFDGRGTPYLLILFIASDTYHELIAPDIPGLVFFGYNRRHILALLLARTW